MEEIDCLIDQARVELQATFSEKHAQLIASTEVFRQTLESCVSNGWKTHASLWNIGIYLNIAAHDLSVLVMQLHFERDVWTRRQIARHVVLTIYEVVEDMTQLLGKKIRAPLEALGLLSRFDTELRKARLPLDSFWRKHQVKLSDVRCMSAAHRDLDGLSLLESIESIDILEISKLGLEVNEILNGIAIVIQSMISEASRVTPTEMKALAFEKHPS